MSWATIVDNQLGSSNDANDSSSVAYGEGALHTIRTAYNEAILCSSSVVDCQDQRWFEAKERLEFVYNECNNYLRSQFGTSVRRQIQELCYVAKRNLINLLLKDAASSATCYSLILDTAQAMLELNKFDASLILLATRYAKQYNDWWTYKQLILLHQSNFPLMYRNLVLNEFNKNSKEMNTIESHNLHIGEFSTADSPLKLSGCSLNTKSAVPFVTFLAHKLLAASCDGAAFSGNNISSNFNMGWVCVELDSAHSPDDMQICQEPAAVTEQREEHGELTNTTTNILQQSQPKESTVVDVLGGEDLVQPLPEVEEEQNQSQAQVQVEATRVSGRVGRRTDRAAAAAADNTAGLPGKGLTRASSQSQLSSGDDSDEHANVQSIKKLLMKAHIGGAYTMSGGAASAIALSTEDEGFRALEYRFAVPVDAIVGTSSPPAPAPDAGRGAEPAGVSGEEKQKSTHRGSAENTSRAVVSSPLFPEVQVAALFEAYKALVTGGGGSMAIQLLINLFVRFIEAVSLIDVEDCTSPAIDAYAISVATLRCWQGLLSNHHGSRSDLLSRLNATERLVLLECALGVIRSFKSPPADQEVAAAGCDVVEGALAAVASDLAVSLLQHVLAPTEAVPESAPFWLASCGNVQVQARTIWAVVIAHRLFPDASCGSAGSSRLLHLLTSLKQFLLTEGAPSRPMKLHLPHVSHSPSKFIDAQACDRLLNSFKYEAEVQSLVDSFAPTTAWVSSALLQVRARKSLSDFLQAADDQKTTLDIVDTAGSTALASRTVPQLLLDACGVLGSWAQWCEVMNALLQAMDTEVSELFAAKKLTSSSAVSEEFAWVAPFLEKVTTCLSAAKLSASSTSIANSDNVHLKSVQHHLAVMVYVFGTRSRHCTVASEICTRCCKLFSALSEAALLADAEGGARSNSSPADVVCPAFTHVSIAVALRLSVDHLHRCSPPAVTGSQEKIPSVLMDMWRFLSEALGRDSVVLSSIPPQAAEYLLLIVCALWERHCAEMPPQLHIALVSVLAQVAVALPALPPPAKASILSHCHWEVLDQSLHLADLSSRSSRRRRRSRTSTSGSSQPCAPISLLMMSLVEDLVYSASFEREFTQREQRGLCFVLGQLYHLLYGLPMVPLESGDSSADEGPAASPTFLTATDGTNSAALVKLYRYTQLCIRGGWVGKAEIRLSLHFLSRAKLFELVPVSPPVLRVFRRIFTLLEDETGVEDSATVEDPAVSTVCGDVALVQGVGQELFHLLLQQGLPASDLLANSSSGGDDADSADGWGDEYTSLNAACDLGPFFLDHKQGITLQLCLKDLNYNPHRASSWHLLLMVLMEAYNALVDELQKLLLLDHLPEACHQFVVPQYRSLFFQGEQASTSALSVWKPTAPVRALVVDQLMASAVAELESACGEPVIAVLGPTFALETHSNGLRSGSAAGSTEDAFCAKVANLLALKNTAFDVLDRAWNVMQSAAGHATDVVDDDADDDHQRSKQTRAETYHLVMRNAVKCYPKSSLQGRRFKFAALKAISTDNCFNDDIFALLASAKLSWETNSAVEDTVGIRDQSNGAVKLSALQLCVRAARQLTVENPRHTFAKPVRVAALYQISSLCIKACFRALRWLGSGEDGAIVDSLALIEECMGLLLPASAVAIAGTAASSSAPVPAPDSSAAAAATVVHAELAEVSTRVWSALLSAWAGLKECRRLDSFDFRSVYRVSDSSRRLAALVSGGEVPLPPQWVVERLKGLGVRELGATAALEELARLFDRKRSQIVAMWCVENAVSPWEKILIRISQFDTLRKKYIDRYFDLAVQCLEVEVVLDVTAFALSALKHATAVVLHVLDRAAIALCLVLSTLLGPTGGGERGDCEDVSHQQQGVSPQQEQSALLDLVGQKKTALVGGANRMLQIVYELHCHLSGRIPPSTMELLEKAMTLLFVHSSHFSLLPTPTPINAPTSTCPSVEEGKGGGDVALTAQLATVGVAPAFGLTATSEAASGSASSSTSTSVTVDVAAAVTPAPSPSAIRSLCAAKWGGAPKLPKTELGKRSKGYFTLATCTSTERAATGSVTVSGSSFETTGTANANPSAVGVSAKDRAAVEAALQAIILLIVSNCSKRPLDDDVVEVEGEGGRDGRVNKLMKTT